MPQYVMLSRPNPEALHHLSKNPGRLDEVRREIEALDAKILHRYALPGMLGFITIVEAPNNVGAFKLAIERQKGGRVRTDIFPAMDLDLFVRLLGQTTETVGPYRWQTKLWAQVVRRLLRYPTMTQKVRKYCKPLAIEGRESLKGFKGPAIFISNHSSHMDFFVLFQTLPERFRLFTAWGGAADRWFLKGRKGLIKQPWYMTLTMNTFPINRGGGRAALSYAEELIDKGWSLVIFPEGTRTTTGKLGQFRHGVSIIALAKKLPVVPVWMEGLRELRPKGVTETKPGPVRTRIGQPIYFPPETTVAEATHLMRKTMERMRDEMRREVQPASTVGQMSPETLRVA